MLIWILWLIASPSVLHLPCLGWDSLPCVWNNLQLVSLFRARRFTLGLRGFWDSCILCFNISCGISRLARSQFCHCYDYIGIPNVSHVSPRYNVVAEQKSKMSEKVLYNCFLMKVCLQTVSSGQLFRRASNSNKFVHCLSSIGFLAKGNVTICFFCQSISFQRGWLSRKWSETIFQEESIFWC